MVLVLTVCLSIGFMPARAAVAGPTVVGMGGVALGEAHKFSTGNPPTRVAGLAGPASDMEYVIQVMASRGMNGVRVDFDPSCTTSPSPIGSQYSASDLAMAIKIAQTYGFYIIVDYHGYTDIFQTTTCWLNVWNVITQQSAGNTYQGIIWEPENEPEYNGASCGSALACMPVLSSAYQQFITQTRGQGDNHWIIVQNICSFGCSLCPDGAGDCMNAVNGFPTVTDSANHVLISIHSYLQCQYDSLSGATTEAQGYYNIIEAAVSQTGWPALNTEGGADNIAALSSCGDSSIVLTGSAGYSNISLSFTQSLTSLYDGANPRVGWLWWPAGDWTDTQGAGVLGNMQSSSSPKGWGSQLNFKPAPTLATSTGPPSVGLLAGIWQFLTLFGTGILIGFVGTLVPLRMRQRKTRASNGPA